MYLAEEKTTLKMKVVYYFQMNSRFLLFISMVNSSGFNDKPSWLNFIITYLYKILIYSLIINSQNIAH